MSEDLAVYLSPPGRVPGIGPERGRQIRSGVTRFVSPHGSYRYVAYRNAVAVGALQVVSSDGRRAVVANVYVVPSARRRGVARELLHAARRDFEQVRHASETHLSPAGKAWRDATGDQRRTRVRG